MKQAFLVFGPESSGTRLTTRILVTAGCSGSWSSRQPWDKWPPNGDRIVWRRSFPHFGEWPDAGGIIKDLLHNGYESRVIVTSRDWRAMARSQVRGHIPDTVDEAYSNIRRAYREIFGALDGVDFEVVNYEAVVMRGIGYINPLLKRWGLDTISGINIYDGNAKYYDPSGVRD